MEESKLYPQKTRRLLPKNLIYVIEEVLVLPTSISGLPSLFARGAPLVLRVGKKI